MTPRRKPYHTIIAGTPIASTISIKLTLLSEPRAIITAGQKAKTILMNSFSDLVNDE